MEVAMNNEVVPMELDVQPVIAKRRRKKSRWTSMVMKHFTIEAASGDRRRARCKNCKTSFVYSMGSIVPTPSHLMRHLGWCQNFTIEAGSDRRMARCKNCETSFLYSIGSIVARPTPLMHHIESEKVSKPLEESEKVSKPIHSHSTSTTAPPKILSPEIISRL